MLELSVGPDSQIQLGTHSSTDYTAVPDSGTVNGKENLSVWRLGRTSQDPKYRGSCCQAFSVRTMLGLLYLSHDIITDMTTCILFYLHYWFLHWTAKWDMDSVPSSAQEKGCKPGSSD